MFYHPFYVLIVMSPGHFPNRIPLAPMWVLAFGSAYARLSAQPPIDTRQNFLCILEVVELAVMVGGRGGGNPYIMSSEYEGEGEAKI
jgi:hypothetical protein